MRTNTPSGPLTPPTFPKGSSGRRGALQLAASAWRLLRDMDNRGVTLVEFGFVGPMLILMMMTIIDLGLMMTTQSLLDGAARDAARMVRTGRVQAAQFSQTGTATSGCALASDGITTFQNCLCSGLTPVMSIATCTSNVVFDVEVFAGGFGSVSFPSCVRSHNNTTGTGTQCNWDPGSQSQIVGVRTTYNYAFIVPWVGACLTPGGSCWVGSGSQNGTGTGTGTVALISTVVFKNEPFPGAGSAT